MFLKGVGESTINQLYKFSKTNKLCLEDTIVKLIEQGNLKPKIKLALTQLTNSISKWRKDSKNEALRSFKKCFR